MMRLDDREWKDFAVPDIFQNIQRGKRLKNADHIPGIVPYVSSTANNNGVDDYIEASEGTRVFKNCISLANSGSVGTAFYEPFAFVASDHVTSLECKEANGYIYLFLTAVLEQQGSNFNFNREINDLRIKKMRVMLPVTDEGKPDYQFMEPEANFMTSSGVVSAVMRSALIFPSRMTRMRSQTPKISGSSEEISRIALPCSARELSRV